MGILSSPYATFMWALEQFSIHFMGSSGRVSDARIVINFIFEFHMPLAASIVFGDQPEHLTMQIPGFAFVNSLNPHFMAGIKKPFDKVNERLKNQKNYADIVFSNFKETEKKGMSKMKISTYVRTAITFVLALALAKGAADGKLIDAPFDKIAYIGLVLSWILSSSTRFALFRAIPCLKLESSTAIIATI